MGISRRLRVEVVAEDTVVGLSGVRKYRRGSRPTLE